MTDEPATVGTDTRAFAPFEWMLAIRYMRARRREGFISVISLFSLIGIMLGVATLIVVMSVFNGFHDQLLNRILGFGGHATILQGNARPFGDYVEVTDKLKKFKFVTGATPFVEGIVMASSSSQTSPALVRGIGENDLKAMKSINNSDLRTAVKVPGTADSRANLTGFDVAGGVAVGEDLSFQHQLGLGSPLSLISPEGPETIMGNTPVMRSYPVVSIFKLGISEYDKGLIYMPLAEAQDFLGMGKNVSGIDINVDDPEDIDVMVPQILDSLGADFTIRTWKSRNQVFFTAIIVQRNVMFLVLMMIVLVAALNIISGLVMLVKDKGRDIGILRTMGATRGTIQRVFFLAGASIGIAGTFAGLLLGLLICANVESIRAGITWLTDTDVFNSEVYYLSELPAQMQFGQIALIVIVALLLSFLATIYPARRAASLDPVEALRYE